MTGRLAAFALALFLSTLEPGAAEAMSTRFGPLSINGQYVLLFNGRPVSPEVRGNSALNFVRKFAVGPTDVVLLEDVGGTACPELFFIVSVAADGARPTPEFGSCGELLGVSQHGDDIMVTARGFQGPFEPRAAQKRAARQKHVFVFRAGVVTENGKPVK